MQDLGKKLGYEKREAFANEGVFIRSNQKAQIGARCFFAGAK
jgi:hypothetical protein